MSKGVFERQATPRQREAVRLLLVENRSKKGEALLEAGYSKSTAIKPIQVERSLAFQREAKPILERLELERDRAISYMAPKIKTAKYRDLTDATDKFTKNIQLLSGKPTEYTLTNELTAEKLQILTDYAKTRLEAKNKDTTSSPEQP